MIVFVVVFIRYRQEVLNAVLSVSFLPLEPTASSLPVAAVDEGFYVVKK